MSECLKIRIQGTDEYLDLGLNSSLKLSKSLQELSELNTIKMASSVVSLMPISNINNKHLQCLLNPNILDSLYKPLKVQIEQCGKIGRESFLYVEGCSPSGYDTEIRNDNDWLKLASECRLCDIPYDDFEWGCATISDNMVNNASYQTGDLGVYFPAVNYGAYDQYGDSISYVRPWHHIKGLLEKGFCKIGYTFKAPILDTDIGCRLIMNCLGDEYFKNPDIFEDRRFRACTTTDQTVDGTGLAAIIVTFDDVQEGTLMDLGFGSFYDGTGTFDFCLEGEMLPDGGNEENILVEIMKTDSNGNLTTIASYTGMPDDFISSNTVGVNLEANNVQVDPGCNVFVRIRGGLLLPNACFFNKFKSVIYAEGDVVNMGKILPCDISIADLLKGVTHLFNWKFYTNELTNTVCAYTPFDVEFFGEPLEGFFTKTEIDLTDTVECDSKIFTRPENIKRFCQLQFKESGDNYIAQQGFSNEVFSHTIDRGEGYVNETEVKENPLFEPTLNAFTQGMFMPQILDNDNDEISFDTGCRILIAEGWVDTTQAVFFKFCDTPPLSGFYNSYPKAYQVSSGEYLAYGTNESPIFISNEKDTLYNIAYKKWLLNFTDNIKACYNVFLTQKDYDCLDFRTPIKIQDGINIIKGYLTDVANFNCCDGSSSKVTFFPQRQLSNECFNNDITLCQNNFTIGCEELNGCFNISIVQNNQSPVTKTVIEWRYTDDPNNWTDISNAPQVCNPDRTFIVRVTSCYEGCNDVVKRITKDPCGNSATCSVFQYLDNDNDRCARLNVDTSGINGPFNVNATYQINGGAILNYVNDICGLQLGDTGIFFIAVEIEGSCENLTLECPFEVPGVLDCSNNAPIVECIPVTGGCFIFGYSGPLVEEPYKVEYFYKCDGGSYVEWDGVAPVCCDSLEVFAVLHFCNCPKICSEVVLCGNEPCNLPLGSPINLSVCN